MRAGSASPVARVLEKAGIGKSARQVSFEGMDRPVLPGTPEFVKALDAATMDGEVMLAYAMNGADLPCSTAIPCAWWCRATTAPTGSSTWPTSPCWTKFDGYWMQKAYRIPDNDCACTPVGKAPEDPPDRPLQRAQLHHQPPRRAPAAGPGAARARRASTADAASARCSSRPMAAKPGAPRNWADLGATPSANGRRTSGRNGRAPS